MITNFLTRAAKLGYFQRGIQIDAARLEGTVPGLEKNLKQACSSYVQGLIDMDEDFLKNTTSPYLFDKILPEIQLIKSKNQSSQTLLHQFSQKVGVTPGMQASRVGGLRNLPMSIFPYVVFGGALPQRFQEHPFNNLVQLTRNRYIAKGVEGISLMNIVKNQSYGFRCYIGTKQKLGYSLGITFEGDVEKQQYSVVDLGDQLLSERGP